MPQSSDTRRPCRNMSSSTARSRSGYLELARVTASIIRCTTSTVRWFLETFAADANEDLVGLAVGGVIRSSAEMGKVEAFFGLRTRGIGGDSGALSGP